MEGVVARRSGDGGVEVVFDEEVGEGLLWEEVEEVDVDVSLDREFCGGVDCEDAVDSILEVFLDVEICFWASFFPWSSVEVDDGMGRVCFLFGVVYLECKCCYLWNLAVYKSACRVFL